LVMVISMIRHSSKKWFYVKIEWINQARSEQAGGTPTLRKT